MQDEYRSNKNQFNEHVFFARNQSDQLITPTYLIKACNNAGC